MASHNLVCANVDLDEDWDELFRSFYNSWSNPIQPVSQLTFAHLGTGTPAEAAACEDAKRTLLADAKAAPGKILWIKCTDANTGRIVGGMCYKYESDWPNEESFTPSWFDQGSEMQRLSKGFYAELLRWRKRCMKKEHMYGESAWVEPAYRNSPASQMIVDFGLKKVDEMGLEAYSEVNQFSAALSLSSGFMIAGWTNMNFVWDGFGSANDQHVPSKSIEHVLKELQAHPIAAVWRPVGGKYVEGTTILPWTGKPRACAKL